MMHTRQVERISVYVTRRRHEVTLIGDQARVESTTEERPVSSHPVVDVAGVQRTQTLHRVGQPSIRTVPEQVEVVVHQAIRVRPNAEPVEHIGEPLTEFDAIAVVEEHIGMVDSTIHHVVPAVLDVRTKWSGHGPHHDEGVRRSGTTRV
ncbi:MAG: hypothetical protein WBL31_00875 [Ilumatobacteraceae bacterium]